MDHIREVIDILKNCNGNIHLSVLKLYFSECIYQCLEYS